MHILKLNKCRGSDAPMEEAIFFTNSPDGFLIPFEEGMREAPSFLNNHRRMTFVNCEGGGGRGGRGGGGVFMRRAGMHARERVCICKCARMIMDRKFLAEENLYTFYFF